MGNNHLRCYPREPSQMAHQNSDPPFIVSRSNHSLWYSYSKTYADKKNHVVWISSNY